MRTCVPVCACAALASHRWQIKTNCKCSNNNATLCASVCVCMCAIDNINSTAAYAFRVRFFCVAYTHIFSAPECCLDYNFVVAVLCDQAIFTLNCERKPTPAHSVIVAPIGSQSGQSPTPNWAVFHFSERARSEGRTFVDTPRSVLLY